MDALISVIIPVYKVEYEIKECLDSVLSQTYYNMEIILIDDGSPDKSGEICDRYAALDKRIIVVHKKNEGQAVARNIALDMCKGDYIVCVDSDDVIKNTGIETLLKLLIDNNADIVVSPYQKFKSKEELFKNSNKNIQITDGIKALEKLLYQNKIYHTGPHCKIFKREIFHNVRFPIGLYYEDLGTTYKLFLNSKKIVATSEYLYGYRIREDSTMRQKYSEKMLSCIPISQELYSFISKKEPRLKIAAASRAFSVNRAIYWHIPYEMKRERYKVWAELIKYRKQVLFDDRARKRERAMAILSYLGKDVFHLLSMLYRRQQLST